MGEYVKYKGTSIKIGTCENLYYAEYGRYIEAFAKGHLKQDIGSTYPEQYCKPGIGFRFRFPFPDEDEQPLGELGYNDFERGLLITIGRGAMFPTDDFPLLQQSYTVASYTQKHLKKQFPMINPNSLSDSVDIEIIQQKPVHLNGKLRLLPVYRCPYSQQMWRMEDEEAISHLAAEIRMGYIEKAVDTEQQTFWDKVNERILSGYAGSTLTIDKP